MHLKETKEEEKPRNLLFLVGLCAYKRRIQGTKRAAFLVCGALFLSGEEEGSSFCPLYADLFSYAPSVSLRRILLLVLPPFSA